MKFIKAVGGLAFVNASSQIVQLAAQPLLGQLYNPKQFGIIAQLTFITSILAIIGTVQIHSYLVLQKKEVDIDGLVGAGIALANIFSITIFPIVLYYSVAIYGAEAPKNIAAFTTILVLTSCYGSLLRGIHTANGRFVFLMRYAIVRAAVLICVQLILGAIQAEDGLVFGLILGEASAIWFCRSNTLEKLKGVTIIPVILKLQRILYDQRDFFFYVTLQELVSVAAFMLPLYAISRLFGNDDGGQFAMAHKMAWAPILLMAQSMSPVIMKYAVKYENEFFKNSVFLKLKFSALFFVLMATFSLLFVSDMFRLLFSRAWDGSAELCGVLAIFSVSFLCAFPYRVCIRVLNKQRVQLYVDCVSIIVLSIAIIAIRDFGLVVVVYAMVLIGVVQNSIISVVARHYINSAIAGNNI